MISVLYGCCLIALFGIIVNAGSVFVSLLCLEVLLFCVSGSFFLISTVLDDIVGIVFGLLVLSVAAVESCIGLALVLCLGSYGVSSKVSSHCQLRG